MKNDTTTTRNQQEIDELINDVREYKETIENALFEPNLSLGDWFSEYITSEDFSALPAERKKEVFNQYENLKYLIEKMNQI